MKDRPKPKSHAVLKNLPAERRDQIAEWCRKPNDRDADGKPVPQTGGLAFARQQLAADGIKVSLQLLSEFFSWWQLEQDLDASFEREDQVLKRTGDRAKAREAAESMLMRLGIARLDPKLIQVAAMTSDARRKLDLDEKSGKTRAQLKVRALDQKDRDHAFEVEKFQFDGAKKALAHLKELRQIAADRALSEPEKIAAVRLKLFGTPSQPLLIETGERKPETGKE